MIQALKEILSDNWSWRKQIWRLAIFDLVKRARGAVLGWAWFFIKPGIYVFCFWFALEVGLRGGQSFGPDAPPYILWLVSGMIPWFFMQDMLGQGVTVLNKYSYLVNKIKFPIGGIPTIYAEATLILQLMLWVPLFIIYFACGQPLDVHLLQMPLLLVMMFVFWDIFSVMCSQLSAISKDFANMMKALGTPFFWLSGVIFNVKAIGIDWIQVLLQFNPITFFVEAFRGAMFHKTWFWEDPQACLSFLAVFVVTLLVALLVHKRFSKEVPDVL